MSLKKVELFTHEIVKRLGAHELGRVSFEIPKWNPDQPGCKLLCANILSEISIGTYPKHRYARMVVVTTADPSKSIAERSMKGAIDADILGGIKRQAIVDSLSDVFRDFFHPAVQMEGYLESPEL
jgi:hypothetical protein